MDRRPAESCSHGQLAGGARLGLTTSGSRACGVRALAARGRCPGSARSSKSPPAPSWRLSPRAPLRSATHAPRRRRPEGVCASCCAAAVRGCAQRRLRSPRVVGRERRRVAQWESGRSLGDRLRKPRRLNRPHTHRSCLRAFAEVLEIGPLAPQRLCPCSLHARCGWRCCSSEVSLNGIAPGALEAEHARRRAVKARQRRRFLAAQGAHGRPEARSGGHS